MLDLVIRGARIIDGTGSDPRAADVAIAAGEIASVGALAPGLEGREIDARGLVLAPGFVDIHTHWDLAIDWPRLGEHLLRQGITTIVGGNCGIGDADVAATLARARRARLPVNVGQLAPFGPIRSRIVERGEGRAATTREAEQVRDAIARALDDGALGLSWGPYHANSLASKDELAIAASALAGRDAPFVVHRRDEGARALEATDEAIAVARAARCRLQVSHLKVAGRQNWHQFEPMLASIDSARRSDDVAVDVYPYEASLTYLNAVLPSELKADGKLLERLATAQGRADARAAVERWFQARQPADRIVLISPPPGLSQGLSLDGAARELGIADPAEAALALIERDPRGEGGWAIYRDMMRAEQVEAALDLADAAIASDSVPEDDGTPAAHPRCYGTFARALARAAKSGEASLARAVRAATSLPCERVGLRGRGVVAPGAPADLVLFDPEKLADAATYEQPARYPTGIALVIVGGAVALERDRPVEGARGEVLTPRR